MDMDSLSRDVLPDPYRRLQDRHPAATSGHVSAPQVESHAVDARLFYGRGPAKTQSRLVRGTCSIQLSVWVWHVYISFVEARHGLCSGVVVTTRQLTQPCRASAHRF